MSGERPNKMLTMTVCDEDPPMMASGGEDRDLEPIAEGNLPVVFILDDLETALAERGSSVFPGSTHGQVEDSESAPASDLRLNDSNLSMNESSLESEASQPGQLLDVAGSESLGFEEEGPRPPDKVVYGTVHDLKTWAWGVLHRSGQKQEMSGVILEKMRDRIVLRRGSYLEGDLEAYSRRTHKGAGAQGEVWEVRDNTSGWVFCVKTLMVRFRPEEVVIMAKLVDTSTEGVCQIHGALRVQGSVLILMECLQGTTLAVWVHELGRHRTEAQLRTILRLFLELLDALELVHRQGIIIEDVKAGNIMVCGSKLTLIDFGLAEFTRTGGLRHRNGTPSYMSPEKMGGEDHGPGVDVYAAAMALGQMLKGSLPINQLCFHGTPDWLPAWLPDWLKKIVESGTASDPQDRATIPQLRYLVQQSLREDRPWAQLYALTLRASSVDQSGDESGDGSDEEDSVQDFGVKTKSVYKTDDETED